MVKHNFTICMLVTFFFLALLGTSFAGDSDSTPMSGTNESNVNASQTKASLAAKNHVYNQEELRMVGSEAGVPFRFDAPETTADLAAKNHVYNQEELRLAGTEAGVPFRFDAPEANDGTNAGNNKDLYCSDC